MNTTICPNCEQDYVQKVIVLDLKGAPHFFLMCFECDAVWFENEKIEYGTGRSPESFEELQCIHLNWDTTMEIFFEGRGSRVLRKIYKSRYAPARWIYKYFILADSEKYKVSSLTEYEITSDEAEKTKLNERDAYEVSLIAQRCDTS